MARTVRGSGIDMAVDGNCRPEQRPLLYGQYGYPGTEVRGVLNPHKGTSTAAPPRCSDGRYRTVPARNTPSHVALRYGSALQYPHLVDRLQPCGPVKHAWVRVTVRSSCDRLGQRKPIQTTRFRKDCVPAPTVESYSRDISDIGWILASKDKRRCRSLPLTRHRPDCHSSASGIIAADDETRVGTVGTAYRTGGRRGRRSGGAKYRYGTSTCSGGRLRTRAISEQKAAKQALPYHTVP